MTRKEYKKSKLLETDLKKSPFEQFKIWFTEAATTKNIEPNAFALATFGSDNFPGIRILLLKSFSESGFIFASNYQSRKGKELDHNKHASMLFYWPELERQVRIEGIVAKASKLESDQVFGIRPLGSKIAAIASPQSELIKDRDFLEKKYLELEKTLNNQEILRPDNWGAYVLKPVSFEFWQGRENRLHDRIVYKLENNQWNIFRLAP